MVLAGLRCGRGACDGSRTLRAPPTGDARQLRHDAMSLHTRLTARFLVVVGFTAAVAAVITAMLFRSLMTALVMVALVVLTALSARRM